MKVICEYLAEDKEKWGNMPYISEKKDGVWVSRSFAETIDGAAALAARLISMGLGGKNIMLFAENSYEWAVISLGVMGYTGTFVPIDKTWTAFDIENTLSVIDVGAIFYDKKREAVIDELREKYRQICFICIEDDFGQLIEDGTASPVPEGKYDAEAAAMILFTSGTTNNPKAIPLSQSNLFANWDTLFRRTPMTEADRTYIFLPLNHVYAGVANFLYTIVSGMQVFLCSDHSKLVEEMLEVRPTVVCTVPLILGRIYAVMNDKIMDMLRGIRFLYCGGSFTEPALKKYFLDSGVTLLEAYGTTETSSVIALALTDDDKPEATGVVMENLDVKIINPDENGIGEIIVGGGSVSSGYISRNDDYSDFDGDGYYHTGDLGYLDETRHLYVKGRKKRVIITANGKNVYVDELESLLTENDDIKSAAVFEEDGHIAARVFSVLPECAVREYVDRVNEKLPKFKQIRRLYVKADTLGGRII